MQASTHRGNRSKTSSQIRHPLRRTLLALAIAQLVGVAGMTESLAQSTLPIVVDKNAAGAHPVVSVAGNGVPVVNIVAPNAAGVSHNNFTQYNVGTSGVVLNNSGANSKTQIAGTVQGNPFLGNRAAGTILNEVTSGNPSQINGVTEVAGNAANVILANPAGIYTDGAGFINTPRVTLTTGASQVGPNGAVTGFNVSQGAITVGGQGIDARGAQQIDLIARSIQINGEVWAQNANATTGANQIAYANDAVVGAATPSGTAPQVALDVSALGGMYANAVRMVGTEQGVGVNMAGTFSALTGDVQLSNNGDVTIAASGRVQAAQNVSLNAANVNNQGAIAANGSLGVSAAGQLANSGSISGSSLTTLSAGGAINNSGSATSTGQLSATAASLVQSGTLSAAGNLNAHVAGPFDQSGNTAAGGVLTLTSGGDANFSAGSQLQGAGVTVNALNLDNQGGVASTTTLSMAATQQLNNQGSLGAGTHAVLVAGSQLVNGGVALAGGNLTVHGASVAQSGTFAAGVNSAGQVTAGGAMSITADAGLSNSGGLYADQISLNAAQAQLAGGTVTGGSALHLNLAGDLNNRNASLSAQQVSLNLGGALDNRGGTIASNAALNLDASRIDNSAGTISSGSNLLLNTGALINVGGQALAGGTLGVTASTLTNGGGGLLVGTRDTHVTATTLDNTGGTLGSSQGNVVLSTTGALNNTDGTLSGALSTQITAGSLLNRSGGQIGGKQLNVTTTLGTLDNTGGAIVGSGATRVTSAGDLLNQSGTLGSTGSDTYLTAAGSFDNSKGQLAAASALGLSARQVNNTQGTISANNLNLDVGAFDNSAGVLAAGQDLSGSVGAFTNAGGSVQAVGSIKLDSGAQVFDDSNGIVVANQLVQISAAQINNSQGTLAGNNVHLTAGAFNNNGGVLGAGQNISGTTGAFTNSGGLVQAIGTINLDSGNQLFDNTQGALVANQSLQIATGSAALINSGGILSGQNLVLSGAALANANGRLLAGNSLSYQGASLDNSGGTLAGNGDVTLAAGTLNNTAGAIHAGGTLTASGDQLINAQTDDGNVDAITGLTHGMEGSNVVLNAGALDNSQGSIRADQNVTISANALNNAAGSVQSTGAVIVNAGSISNTIGLLSAGQNMSITANTLSGDGTVQSQGDLGLYLSSDFTNTGNVLANHDLNVSISGDIVNSGTFSAGNALSMTSRNLTNQASGQIMSGASTVVHADQSITNAGLINGGDTTLTATDVINTGQIYGDHVAIGASNSIVNDADPTTGIGGVIASRGDMDLAAPTIVNQNQALIYASGDLNVGSVLDGNHHATGQAASLLNNGAEINVGGNATFNVAELHNANANFSSTQVTTPDQHSVYYTFEGSTVQIDPGSVVFYDARNNTSIGGTQYPWITGDSTPDKYMIVDSATYPLSAFGPPFAFSKSVTRLNGTTTIAAGPDTLDGRSKPVIGNAYLPATTVCTGGDHGSCYDYSALYLYGSGDAIWGLFGIAAPAPQPTLAQYNNNQTTYQAALDAWTQANQPLYLQLNVAIAAFNTDLMSRTISNFIVYDSTITTTTDVALNSDPGRIIVGGGSSLNGHLTNDQSQYVVGGTLVTSGPAITNNAAIGHAVTTGSSIVIDSHVCTSCWDNNRSSATTTQPFPTHVVDIPLDVSTQTDGRGPGLKTVTAATAAQGSSGLGVATGGANGPGSVGAPTGTVNAVDAPGDAIVRTVSNPGTVPNNALYTTLTDPASPYLVQTDPHFIGITPYVSSDSMLTQLGDDPGSVLKRLGDGFYEQQLVANQIMLATGQRFIGDYTNNQNEYAALLSAGVDTGKQFGLTVGTALTDAQMASLSSDIVWLVKQTVTLANGTTQDVLVPQVYLRANSSDITGTGTIIAANNINMQGQGTLTNTGTIAARNVAIITADNVVNRGALSANALQLTAVQDINNIAGSIQANTAVLGAGHDINLSAITFSSGTGQNTATYINGLSSLNVGNLQIGAGHDINAQAAQIAVTGNALLAANNDINLTTATKSSNQHAQWTAGNSRDQTSSVDVGTAIQTGNALTMVAGHDVNATAAYANADGAINIAAGNDVNLNAGNASVSASDERTRHSSGVLSSASAHSIDSSSQSYALGSTLSGDTVNVQAGHDIAIQGGNVVGTGDVNLAAKNNLTITTASNTSTDYHESETHSSGFGGGGGGFGYSVVSTKDKVADNNTYSVGSLVGSTSGDVNMSAGNTLHITGSNVMAATGDITGSGANVIVDDAHDTAQHDESHEVHSFSVSVGAGGMAGSMVQLENNMQSMSDSSDGRVAALRGISSAGTVAGMAQAASAGNTASGITLTVGMASSKSQMSDGQTISHGSSLDAGGRTTLIATGRDANGRTVAGTGDLTIQGSQINGTDVVLGAANNINLLAGQDTDSSRNSSSSTSGSMSVGYNGGWSFSASGSTSHGNGNSDSVTNHNTHIDGSNSVTFVSGNDTNIAGANINAGTVTGLVGGDLNIRSVQDTEAAHQQSTSAGFSVSTSGGNSANAQHQTGNSSYASVVEQSGIQAGKGGFDILVNGNTALAGGVIASTADASQNHLSTGTLSFSDIDNASSYSASTVGISTSGMSMPVHNGANQSGETRSAISTGDITINRPDQQKQDIASLSRDATDANTGAMANNNPNLQQTLSNQAEVSAAATAAMAATAKTVGDIRMAMIGQASTAVNEAKTTADANPGDPAAQQALADARQTMANWEDGGIYSVGLHVATAAAITALGGGNALGAAVGTAAGDMVTSNQAVRDAINTAMDSAGIQDPATRKTISDNALAAAAAGAGYATGGGAGAFSADSTTRNNANLHNSDTAKINALANSTGISADRLTAAACAVADNCTGSVNDPQAMAAINAAREADPTFMVDDTPAVTKWVNTAVTSYGKGIADGVKEAAALWGDLTQYNPETTADVANVSAAMGEAPPTPEPFSKTGQSIQQNGIWGTAGGMILGPLDVLNGMVSGDPQAWGNAAAMGTMGIAQGEAMAAFKGGAASEMGEAMGTTTHGMDVIGKATNRAAEGTSPLVWDADTGSYVGTVDVPATARVAPTQGWVEVSPGNWVNTKANPDELAKALSDNSEPAFNVDVTGTAPGSQTSVAPSTMPTASDIVAQGNAIYQHYNNGATFDALEQWATTNPATPQPGIAFSGVNSSAFDNIVANGLKAGEALGQPAGSNASNIWFKTGEPFYQEGLALVIPSNRLAELGGVESTGLAGQSGVVTVPFASRPEGIPINEFAVVAPIGFNYVVPVYVPPTWSGSIGNVPPAQLLPPGMAIEPKLNTPVKGGFNSGSVDPVNVIKDVNPTGSDQNCTNCALATDATLRGNPTSALPNQFADRIGANLGDLQSSMGSKFIPGSLYPDEVTALLEQGGQGATGVVASQPAGGAGHVVNGVNSHGQVVYVDGQTGGKANVDGSQPLFFMPLPKLDGTLWTPVLNPDGSVHINMFFPQKPTASSGGNGSAR